MPVAPPDDLERLRYPIGPLRAKERLTPEERQDALDRIASLPERLRAAVADLDDDQLDTPYRPGGWTVRQVVHHVPDSHLNSYVRFKWAVTEERPTLKAYDEGAWAELQDSRRFPVEASLNLLEALHDRWTAWLRTLDEAEWSREIVHPDQGQALTLDGLLQMYRWHGDHHLAHVTSLRDRKGW